jgi:hypothetical protein
VPDEYVEFDTKALLRSSFKEMIEALSNGTRRVMAPNEARKFLDLPEKDGGDQLFVQMQDIPLSMAGKQATPPAPAPSNDDDKPDDDAAGDEKANERARQFFRSAHARSVAV